MDLKRDYDRRVAQQVTNTSNVGTASNVASSWSDRTNSDPFGDINTTIDHIRYGTGYTPNAMLIGPKAFDNLTRHNDIIDKSNRTSVTGAANNASVEGIKSLFKLNEVIVADGFYNAADEGQTLNVQPVMDDHVLLYYKTDRASIVRPTFGATFRLTNPALPQAMAVQRIPFSVGLGALGMQA